LNGLLKLPLWQHHYQYYRLSSCKL